jgi:peptidoglycan hydrolase-like protein with peptidoglycan-binding domain
MNVENGRTASAEPESSTGADPQDVSQQATAAPAESSDATPDVGPDSMLAAVKAALEQDRKPEESSTSEAEGTGQTEAVAEGTQTAADPDSELRRLLDELTDDKTQLGKVQRFKAVLDENKTLRQQLESVRPAVDRVQEIANAARMLGLTPDEVSDYFEAVSLAKDDPNAAFEKVDKIRSKFATVAGRELPPDLVKRVEDGFLDKDGAQELAQARALNQRLRTQAEIDNEQREAERHRTALTQMKDAVGRVEIELRSSDPDLTPAKYQMVRDQVLLRKQLAGREPSSPEEAVTWVREAHKTVTDRLKEIMPRAEPRRDPPARRINSPAKAEPSSMLEAVRAGLESANS